MARVPHPRLPPGRHLANLRGLFRAAYPGPVRVKETTPQVGGVRTRDVEALIGEGFAEWVEWGISARMKDPVPKELGSVVQDLRHQNGLDD